MTNKRKHYTPEFRQEAAGRVIDSGRTIVSVAAELGLSAPLLGRWVARYKAELNSSGEPGLTESERAELVRLRRETQEQKLDLEFLGKAAAFFAATSEKKKRSR